MSHLFFDSFFDLFFDSFALVLQNYQQGISSCFYFCQCNCNPDQVLIVGIQYLWGDKWIQLWRELNIFVVLRYAFFNKNFNFLFFVLNDFILFVLLILIILCPNMLAKILPKLIIKSSLRSRSLDDRLLKFLLFFNK